MTTRFYHHPGFLEHETPQGHVERADRIRAIEQALLEDQLFEEMERVEAPLAERDAAFLAHDEAYVETLLKTVLGHEEIVQLDPDTYAGPHSIEAAFRGMGAAMAGIDDLFSGRADNVFVCSRPPGHHAERDKAMGFCLFNNVAIAARHAQKVHGVERVAIIDFDVHHGNGTQDIFWNDKNVLFASTHQADHYPHTGFVHEVGAGNVLNAPLAAGSGSHEFREAMETRVFPALDNMAPDLIVLSAGFDAHRLDSLGDLNLDEDDFDWVTGKLMERAARFCNDRVLSVLEGGYNLHSLAFSATRHIARLMKG
ncbi:histone deacetylase family protein [Limoniibacter endophyticus]|uniref:Acetoin utilization protein n=1 Tax=Limoniibacter endophyticus TaxID=1565040 RepID=A0A8J3DQA5_9HYPH|nr:histone deacetylase family protein [Limoniibacter endophyticus]GHC71460.1 acetoin utilization protein [Limoniibacter endophyticus]